MKPLSTVLLHSLILLLCPLLCLDLRFAVGLSSHVPHTVTVSVILVICLVGGGGLFQQPADSCHGITLLCFASPGLVLTALSNCTACLDKCCNTAGTSCLLI